MELESNKEFESYLERYCESRNISKEEAMTHAIVKEIKKSYEEK